MDEQLKKELLKGVAPATVPLCRAFINNHYENKRIEQRQQFEIEKAEYTNRSLQAAAGGGEEMERAEQPAPPSFDHEVEEVEPAGDPLGEAIDLAEDLERTLGEASEHEECAFCQDVLEGLQDEPLEVQQQGLRELRRLRKVMYSDPSRDEIDRTMDELEVVPRLIIEG